MNRYTCVCCGHITLLSYHDWEMCPVCCWEDDVLGDLDSVSPANHDMLLSQGQANYLLYGVSDLNRKTFARIASVDEPLNASWRPFANVEELVRRMR